MTQSMKNNFSGQSKGSKKKMMSGSSNHQSMVTKSNKSYDKNAITQMSSQQPPNKVVGIPSN
jgi:uncharacterized protein YukJ